MTTQEKIARMNKDGHRIILDPTTGNHHVGDKTFKTISDAYRHFYGDTKSFTVVVDWVSTNFSERVTRMVVKAQDEDHACDIVLDIVKGYKQYLKLNQVSIVTSC